MSLSGAPASLLAVAVLVAYLIAALPGPGRGRWPAVLLFITWVVHGLTLLLDAGVWREATEGLRLGFAPVLSFTLWLVIGVHGVESRFLPLPGARRILASCAAASMVLFLMFPGDVHAVSHSRWAPLHWVLGLASYGLFGAAVLHAVLLDRAERRMRLTTSKGAGAVGGGGGMPLLKIERLTFRYVEAGFVVLTLALLFGLSSPYWRFDHKTDLSLLSWAVFAALIVGRLWRGWRGRQATRWLYAGTVLLLLSYVGTRFVFEVLLQRTVA